MSELPEVSKEERRATPSGWLYLCKDESVHYIIDALLSVDHHREFTQTELARISGVSAQSVRRHIDRLVELGIVTEVAGGRRYSFDMESDVGQLVAELNGAIVANSYEGEDAEDGATDPVVQ